MNIKETLQSYNRVIYIDTSVRLKLSAIKSLIERTKDVGVLTKYHETFISCFSDPRSFKWFQEDISHFEGVYSLEANLVIIDRTNFVAQLIMKAWVTCALDIYCIAPPGCSQIQSNIKFKKIQINFKVLSPIYSDTKPTLAGLQWLLHANYIYLNVFI